MSNLNGSALSHRPHSALISAACGPTLTMMAALTSPALDSGELSTTGTDQRGLPRNANGRSDMGAVERQYPEDVIFRNGVDPS